MRRYMAAAVCVMMLAAGCSSGSSDTSISPVGERTSAEVVTAAEEGSGEGLVDGEAVDASVESLEARVEELEGLAESLESVEESLMGMEESIQEVLGSMAGETSAEEEEEAEETPAVAYEELMSQASGLEERELTYTGSVVQFASLDNDMMQLLIAVDGDLATQMVCEFNKSRISVVLGHGDIVTVTGTFTGVNRYMTANGERVELPTLSISGLTVDRVAETEAEAVPETIPETVPETTIAPPTEPETTAAPRGPLG